MGKHSIGSCALGCPVVAPIAAAAVHVLVRVCTYIATELFPHETQDSVPQ